MTKINLFSKWHENGQVCSTVYPFAACCILHVPRGNMYNSLFVQYAHHVSSAIAQLFGNWHQIASERWVSAKFNCDTRQRTEHTLTKVGPNNFWWFCCLQLFLIFFFYWATSGTKLRLEWVNNSHNFTHNMFLKSIHRASHEKYFFRPINPTLIWILSDFEFAFLKKDAVIKVRKL